ncbi:Hypothetical predicted protein [Mytilus galloprovincialis]|uniref:F-box domain-containing protein n=1 Tax=Mytilus galloprovincialis TaxID=29158 RepID=A0A8B6CVG9_MYTGA|nr:Hypothetical predicted protein [Mytilus galloprovincialis]
MNINDIPSELLLHILSYVPQSDLFTNIDQVCDLWKHVDYTEIYGDYSQPFEHVRRIQNFVKSLTITPGHIIEFFGFQRKLQFVNLKSLDVSDNLVVSEVFFDKIIQRCPNLKKIKFISGTRINMEHCLEKLKGLNLTELDIGYFYGTRTLDDELISLLRKQPELTKLALRGWKTLKDSSIASILNDCTKLNSFYLFNGHTSNGAFMVSEKDLLLAELTIHSNLLDDEGLQNITGRTKILKLLNIEQSSGITDCGMVQVTQNCPSLENISFGNPSNSENISNRTLFAVAENCSLLKSLSTTGCRNIDDDGIIEIAKSCRHLTLLTLNGCTELRDESLFAIGEHCHSLREIDFSYCSNITFSGVYFLINSCPNLNSLILSFCNGISHANLKESSQLTNGNILICGSHSHLKELILRYCTHITKEAVLILVDLCPDLRKLSLSNCLSDCDDDFLCRVFEACTFLTNYKVYNKMIRRQNYNRTDLYSPC